MSLAQLLVNSVQRSLSLFGRMNRRERAVLKCKFGLGRVLLLFGDPPVRHRMAGHDLLLPLSHKLWIDDAATPGRSDNLARIAARVHARHADLCCIDIGANVGDTVAVLRSRSRFPILAIEGDSVFYAFLERNMKEYSDVSTFQALLSDVSSSLPGRMVTNYGGSKQVEKGKGSLAPLRFHVLPEILELFPKFGRAKMVKIDTDGFDCKIIRGALPWVTKARPVIFFEYDPFHLGEQGDDGVSVFHDLSGAGYAQALVYDGGGEFMYSLDLRRESSIGELHAYFLGKGSKRYANICVFHTADRELFEECRAEELKSAPAARFPRLPE